MEDMVYKNKYFVDNGLEKVVCRIFENPDELKDSHSKIEGFPFREFYGLSVLAAFREHVEGTEKWFFTTDKNEDIDDGAISFLNIDKRNIDYPHDVIEQVYLSKEYPKEKDKSYEDTLINFLEDKKLNRSETYKGNKSLLLLNDLDTDKGFNWINILKIIFPKTKVNFRHFYYISHQGHDENASINTLLSYTDNPCKTYLNGVYKFYLYKNESKKIKFKKIQDIDDDVFNTKIFQ